MTNRTPTCLAVFTVLAGVPACSTGYRGVTFGRSVSEPNAQQRMAMHPAQSAPYGANAAMDLQTADPRDLRGSSADRSREPTSGTEGFAQFGQDGWRGEATGAQGLDSVENLRQISFSRVGSDFDPAISSDGSLVYFSTTAHSTASDIFVKRTDGSALTQLTTDPAMDIMPAVSPDGQRIAFASNRAGSWDIYVMSNSGGQPIQVTNDPAQELHPTWSPDGRRMAFSRLGTRSGRWEIWMVEMDRPAASRFLTYGLFPDWHPSADKLVFQRPRQRDSHLFAVWTVDLVGGEATAPTIVASSATSAIINPKWSRDGSYIAMATIADPGGIAPGQRPSRSDVWIMKPDGSARAKLTSGSAVNLMPTWGAGRQVFFVSDRNGSDNIWARAIGQATASAGDTPGLGSVYSRTPNNHDNRQTAEIANVPADISDQR